MEKRMTDSKMYALLSPGFFFVSEGTIYNVGEQVKPRSRKVLFPLYEPP